MATELNPMPNATPIEQSRPYTAYVKRLTESNPELNKLYRFLRQKCPHNWVEDIVTIYDISNSSWKKSICSSVARLTDGSHPPDQDGVHRSLAENSPLKTLLDSPLEGIKTRIICVDQLTPDTVELLGMKYNLNANFFNDHVPEFLLGVKTPAVFSQGRSILHFDFRQLYRWIPKTIKSAPLTQHSLRYRVSNSVRKTLNRLYVQPLYDVEIEPDRLGFTISERISLYRNFSGFHVVVLVFYPLIKPVELDSERSTGVEITDGIDGLPEPSWSEVSGRSITLSTGQRFCNEMDLALNRFLVPQQLSELSSPFIWLCSLFRVSEQRVLSEASNTTTKLAEDEIPRDINDADAVWKEANATAKKIAAQRTRLREIIRSMDDLQDEVLYQSQEENSPKIPHEWTSLRRRFDKLYEQSNEFVYRAEQVTSTFLALVQLNETRQAIKQTESVRRLTNLAFVFIPLSLVAGIFSAGIQEMDNHRTVKAFSLTCLLTTILSILAALTFEQYIFVWLLWPFRKYRTWVYSLLEQYNRQRDPHWRLWIRKYDILEGSSRWFVLIGVSAELLWNWLSWQLYRKWRDRKAAKASENTRRDQEREIESF